MAITTEAEFTALYRANYEDVLRFVKRRAHPLNVDDIVGETFLAAWRRRRELPVEARAWLFGVARNAMLNSSRGTNRQTAVAVRIAEHDDESVDGGLPGVDDRLDLITAWRSMDPTDQEVLALHVWEDLSDRDAAAVLGCSRGAYAMRLSRAKRNLAVLLETSSAPQYHRLATHH
jgi:RNA polymerase sigma-70 factor (ECF subfamily)